MACDAPIVQHKTRDDLCNECTNWVRRLLKDVVDKEDIDRIFGVDDATVFIETVEVDYV